MSKEPFAVINGTPATLHEYRRYLLFRSIWVINRVQAHATVNPDGETATIPLADLLNIDTLHAAFTQLLAHDPGTSAYRRKG